jgi:hypothetical protein
MYWVDGVLGTKPERADAQGVKRGTSLAKQVQEHRAVRKPWGRQLVAGAQLVAGTEIPKTQMLLQDGA